MTERTEHNSPNKVSVRTAGMYNEWDAAVQGERSHQREIGYDTAHDAEHGVDHLLMWAQDYARRGKPVKSAAMIEAARELLSSYPLGEGQTQQGDER